MEMINYYKLCFKLIENCDVSHLEDEPSPHVVRVGWSAVHTSMQLGKIFIYFFIFIIFFIFFFVMEVFHLELFSYAG
jgi:hypothetical protein